MGDANENQSDPMPVEEPDPRDSEKIDLSLDEIIKRNKKEQRANSKATKAKNKRLANRNNVLRKLNKDGQQSSIFSRRGAYQFQGPYRAGFTGPAFRGFYRRRGFGFGRGFFRGTGVSPLNRTALDTKVARQFGQLKFAFRGAFSRPYRGRGQGLGRGRNTAQFQANTGGRGARPFVLNRTFPSSRGRGTLERFQKVRGWRRSPSAGSMLTVSLPNSKAPSEPRARTNSGVSSDSFAETAGPSFAQPKGIPLNFNFKATSNQTAVTLNDRFTTLKIRSQGQRSWRGESRGRARGRGRAGGRGRGGMIGRGGGIGRGAVGRGGGIGRGAVGRGGGIGRGAVGRGGGFRRGGVGRGRGRGFISSRGGGRGRGQRDNRTVTLQ